MNNADPTKKIGGGLRWSGREGSSNAWTTCDIAMMTTLVINEREDKCVKHRDIEIVMTSFFLTCIYFLFLN